MRTKTKVWLLVATSLVLVGGILFAGVMTTLGWDFTKLSTAQYETNYYEIAENYNNIRITTDTAHIVFVPAENDKSSVVCFEQKNSKHLVTVKEGTLVIEVVDVREWFEHIGINFGMPKITVSIPQAEYGTLSVTSGTGDVKIPKEFKFESMDIWESTGDVTNSASASQAIKIKTSTGNIRIENVSAGSLDLSVSTGGVTVSNVVCQDDVKINVSTGKTNLTEMDCMSVISSGTTGDISLKNVMAAEKFSIKRSTGDVRFDCSDAAHISVQTDTGDVTGSLLTEKIFITQTETGDVAVPPSTTGGRCEITTDTGDVSITLCS